jgi:hypothetical protein
MPERCVLRLKLFDLNGEVNSASKKHNSATIVVDDRQFCYRINPDGVFSTHSGELQRFVATEIERWGKIVQQAGWQALAGRDLVSPGCKEILRQEPANHSNSRQALGPVIAKLIK